jgi:hypothetical protein
MPKFSLFYKDSNEPITVKNFNSISDAIIGFARLKDLDVRTFSKIFDVEYHRDAEYNKKHQEYLNKNKI